MLGFERVGGLLSQVLTRIGSNGPTGSESLRNGGAIPQRGTMGQGVAIKLKFHPVHGKAMHISDNARMASRDSKHFEHGVLFSHRPIALNESVALEITELSSEFNGPVRIGFTSINPNAFIDEATGGSMVPLGRDLKNYPGVWIKAIHLFELEVGTTVYWKVHYDGSILYGVNGERGGIFLRHVETSVPLWAVVVVYGKVKAAKFVNKTMMLTHEDENGINLAEAYRSPSPYRSKINNGPLRRDESISASSLALRRSVILSPIENINKMGIPSASQSALNQSPLQGFFTPPPFEAMAQGLCIVCVDRVKNAAFINCGHLCMCYECASSFINANCLAGKRQLCPICRRGIASILKIFH